MIPVPVGAAALTFLQFGQRWPGIGRAILAG